jgi:hypothetical protein
MKKILILFFIILVTSLLSINYLRADSILKEELSFKENIERVFILEQSNNETKYLTLTTAPHKLNFYLFSNGKNQLLAEREADCYVEQATFYSNKEQENIITTCGVSRGNLTAKLEVFEISSDLKRSQKIYQFDTTRSETNYIKQIDDKLIINYFISKYETSIGYFKPDENGKWQYRESKKLRIATNMLAFQDYIVLGRMYGDQQGQDGDVLAGILDQELVTLPSYRGVYSMSSSGLVGGRPETIYIGDGWHQNYGQFAQARLSALKLNQEAGRYNLDLINIFRESYAVTRTEQIDEKNMLVVTNNFAYIAKLGKDWSFTKIASQTDTYKLFDLRYLGKSQNKMYFIVSDSKVAIFSF